jgi:outer membrane immunogenic protein
MKKALSVAALLVALTGSALAADLPSYKAPPPPPLPPPPLWSGFYVGLNAGGTWGGSNNIWTSSAPIYSSPGFAPASLYAAYSALGASGVSQGNTSGFIGGGQIGYNWQFWGGRLVAGVEADIQGVAGSNSNNTSVTAAGAFPFFGAPSEIITTAITTSKRLDYIGTVRGRLGWLFTPTLLVYGTGGLAYGGVSVSTGIAQFNNDCAQIPAACLAGAAFSSGAFSDTRVGWTVGGGLEWMFMPNWSAKVEYLYYDLGNVSYSAGLLSTLNSTITALPAGSIAGVVSQSQTRFNGNIVRAGVNYHFNWGAAPIVAKY